MRSLFRTCNSFIRENSSCCGVVNSATGSGVRACSYKETSVWGLAFCLEKNICGLSWCYVQYVCFKGLHIVCICFNNSQCMVSDTEEEIVVHVCIDYPQQNNCIVAREIH